MSHDAPLPPIVCLAGIEWAGLWQRSQTLTSGFAQRGARVAFIEQLDAGRSVQVRDWRRVLARGRNLLRRRYRWDRGVHVLTPATVPLRFAAPLNRRLLSRLARRLQDLGFQRPIVWHYPYGGPNSTRLEQLLSPRLLVYDCVSRVRGYPYATPEVIAAEEALARRADLVLTDARILWEEKRAVNPRCVQVPPGVDFELFAPCDTWEEPAPLRDLRHPRLGFFGGINERLDQATLLDFAAHHPEWTVILIGPVLTDVSAFRSAPNVRLLPQVAHAALGGWLQALDVITIPYHATEFTRGIIPAKLFEALATGKPVVAMGLPELDAYEHVIHLCRPDGFGAAVTAALATDSPTGRERRLALARENSWTSRIDQVWGLLQTAIEEQGRADRGSA